MCVGICKNKFKKRFRIGVFFAIFFYYDRVGVGVGVRGWGEVLEGKVTLGMLVKVSFG